VFILHVSLIMANTFSRIFKCYKYCKPLYFIKVFIAELCKFAVISSIKFPDDAESW
jgi:hypothetical protein